MNGHTLRTLVEAVTPEWGRIRDRVPEVGRHLVESDVESPRSTSWAPANRLLVPDRLIRRALKGELPL